MKKDKLYVVAAHYVEHSEEGNEWKYIYLCSDNIGYYFVSEEELEDNIQSLITIEGKNISEARTKFFKVANIVAVEKEILLLMEEEKLLEHYYDQCLYFKELKLDRHILNNDYSIWVIEDEFEKKRREE